MARVSGTSQPMSSVAHANSAPKSSVFGGQRVSATSIFHTGNEAASATSIFRVGNAQQRATSSIMHSALGASDSNQTESAEKAQDDQRYMYARKVLKRKRISEALEGYVDDSLKEKIASNSFSSSDMRQIRIQIDDAVAAGKLSSGEGKKFKYTLGEL